tara:strand:- start:67 stop:435 length:369 start_codon:yes stop_codon:yes gene_type:complete
MLEGYTYLSILTEGTMGTSPYGFITGDKDLSSTMTTTYTGLDRGTESLVISGAEQISLKDLASEPSLAIAQISANAQTNFIPMAIQTAFTNVGFSLFKKGLRKPIARVNSQIFRPLGLGVRL